MTVIEAKIKKQRLERDIWDAVSKFEKETQASVVDIRVELCEMANGSKLCAAVMVAVEM